MGFLGQMLGNKISGADKAPQKAAQIEAQASDRALAEQQRQYDLSRADQLAQYQQQRTDQAPWLQAGTAAIGRLQDPNAFTASPGYAFRLGEGQKAQNNAFAASGGAFSGNALKALADYNQNIASSEYGNWWNQQAGLAGIGQTAASQTGQAGQNYVNQLTGLGQNYAASVGNLLQNSGNARASGIIGTAAVNRNAFNQGMNNDAQNFGYFFGKRGGWGG